MATGQDESPLRKKRARRPRGKGLRTRTGCLTCRKRHKKCDEKQPVCGPCSTSSRNCVFARDLDAQSALASLTQAPPPSGELEGDKSIGAGQDNSRGESHQVESYSPNPIESQALYPPQHYQGSPNTVSVQTASPQNIHGSHYAGPWPSDSATATEKWTANFASTRWLDLLANDAAQADGSFSLAPSPEPESRRLTGQNWQAIFTHVSPALLNGQAQLPENLDPEDERKAWQSESDVILTDYEAVLFRHFADSCARCLDIFDPQRLFSNYAIRLALKNSGLMKAILALSAKHRSNTSGCQPRGSTGQPVSYENTNVDDSADGDWIGYYYETLHYIRKALVYSSYTHSEELLATAIVISSYEMLDEADGSGNWQRHLKGVFWIQRSQDVDGDCGGLRQAVWWAWLRQDIWAAFREKRPCLTIWKPKKTLEEMNQYELANRALYLLSRAVNYSAEARKMESMPMPDHLAAAQLKQRRKDLFAYIDRWRSLLGDEFNVLPTPKKTEDVFTPLWVHPPEFGVALQAYNFAILLITLHTPNGSGISAFLRMQKKLSSAVDTICGIAMELKEESCQVMSAQFLFGAGLCVQDEARREKIISLMEECEMRVRWAPISTWREDLRKEWANMDGNAEIEHP